MEIIDFNWFKQRGSFVPRKNSFVTNVFQFPSSYFGKADQIESPTEESSEAVILHKSGSLGVSDESLTDKKILSCRLCSLVFEDVPAMRAHYRSDEHVFNIRRGISTTSESSKNNDDAEESDESSSNSGESEKDEDEEPVGSWADSQPRVFPEGFGRKVFDNIDGPRTTLQRRSDDFEVTISNSIIQDEDNNSVNDNPWVHVRKSIDVYSINSVWCVLSLRSGRFAAAIFDGQTIVTHKNFRRYTVRAKAGGGQSSYDNQGKKARSAGAMLRRYGEQALREDIRNLMKSWQWHLSRCSLILMSVPRTMRGILFDEEKGSIILDRLDPRIRYVPFMTDRPTLETVKEIHSKCSTIYVSSVIRQPTECTDTSNGALEIEKISISAVNVAQILAPSRSPINSDNILIRCPEADELFSIIKTIERVTKENNSADIVHLSTDAEEVIKKITLRYSSNTLSQSAQSTPTADGISSPLAIERPIINRELSLNLTVEDVINLPSSAIDFYTSLHHAAELGNTRIITALLRAGADPTKKDVRGRPAYFLCKSKDARDSFRRYRAEAEDRWNWSLAGIPDALTPEMEKAQKDKEKEKKKRAKAKKVELKSEDNKESSFRVATIKNAVPVSSTIAKGQDKTIGSVRFTCANCGYSLFGKTSFDVFDRRCCDSDCAAKYKRKLLSEAAESRLQKTENVPSDFPVSGSAKIVNIKQSNIKASADLIATKPLLSTSANSVSSNVSSEFDPVVVLQLVEMGFGEPEVHAALRASSGDSVVAVEYLMSGL